MANFYVDGMTDMIAKLRQAPLTSKQDEEEILFAAGDILVAELRARTGQSNFKLEAYKDGIQYKPKIKYDKYGDPYITATIKGKNARGQRKATVMFVLNYGRSKPYGAITGTYFWTKGSQDASRRIAKEIEAIINRKLQERGLL